MAHCFLGGRIESDLLPTTRTDVIEVCIWWSLLHIACPRDEQGREFLASPPETKPVSHVIVAEMDLTTSCGFSADVTGLPMTK